MRNYFIKTPWWLKKIYPKRVWDIDTIENEVFLTFDDGPHPIATPFVLDELKKYNAKATFFCIGKNVIAYPDIYKRIIDEGHRVGNHTQHHLNGWKTNNATYLNDVEIASKHIRSNLFRPPYGRLRSVQAKQIARKISDTSTKIIMWDVLSGDFDENVKKEECLKNILKNSRKGSIIVFHDSEKAYPRLVYALPELLRVFTYNHFQFKALK